MAIKIKIESRGLKENLKKMHFLKSRISFRSYLQIIITLNFYQICYMFMHLSNNTMANLHFVFVPTGWTNQEKSASDRFFGHSDFMLFAIRIRFNHHFTRYIFFCFPRKVRVVPKKEMLLFFLFSGFFHEVEK